MKGDGSTLIDELIASLERGLDKRPLTVDQVCIGVFYTAVQLSDGHVGVAFTPRDLADTVCCPRSAAEMPQAGRLRGRTAWDLADEARSRFRLRRAVGVATLNALSASLMAEKGIPGGRIVSNADALDMAHIGAGDSVVLVGAFIPFIKKLKEQGVKLRVIDKHRDALRGEDLPLWAPPESIDKVLPEADIAVITGSALVEGGLDGLLELCSGARGVVLAGPTASPWPEPFFARGVTVLGGIRVRDGAEFMRLVAEGGSGYFFSGPAEKIAVVKSDS
ncbi:MAG: DUF364 domain-containing protein [Chloroflexi bacterium]|nr:DUF364 domain-containing protein [Chloroflexota bacterium]